MVTRKEDTPRRISNRKYEEKNKEERRKMHANFQTMIDRKLYDEIDAFLKKKQMTKVDFIKNAFEYLKTK